MRLASLLLAIAACGGKSPPAVEAAPLAGPSCEQKCERESEWWIGCMTACRQDASRNASSFQLAPADAGVDALTIPITW